MYVTLFFFILYYFHWCPVGELDRWEEPTPPTGLDWFSPLNREAWTHEDGQEPSSCLSRASLVTGSLVDTHSVLTLPTRKGLAKSEGLRFRRTTTFSVIWLSWRTCCELFQGTVCNHWELLVFKVCSAPVLKNMYFQEGGSGFKVGRISGRLYSLTFSRL